MWARLILVSKLCRLHGCWSLRPGSGSQDLRNKLCLARTLTLQTSSLTSFDLILRKYLLLFYTFMSCAICCYILSCVLFAVEDNAIYLLCFVLCVSSYCCIYCYRY